MPSRDKILNAAARVYATAGYRGATTRRIAEEAGVNEVTLFRHFGSKAALIEQALRASTATEPVPGETLPEQPEDPERELTAWCARYLDRLRATRSMFRKAMGEANERPEGVPCFTNAPLCAGHELKAYMKRMRAAGLYGGPGREVSDAEAHAAGTMLMSALLGDAMGREMMSDLYPRPAERAPALYVRMFLRALRCAPVQPVQRDRSRGDRPRAVRAARTSDPR